MKRNILAPLFISTLLSSSCSFNSLAIELKYQDTYGVLQAVKQYLPSNPVIIDAGACNGSDSVKMKQVWPASTVHAFEPVPNFFQALKRSATAHKTIHCYPTALSDTNGKAKFNLSFETKSGVPWNSGSLLAPKDHLKYCDYVSFRGTIDVETVTLDTWAQNNNITHIDFLWFDLQGYELKVLKASPNILKTVKIIYTEVEFVEAYEGQYLYQETKEWLENQGFTLIGQDFKEGDSKRWFGNILMVRK